MSDAPVTGIRPLLRTVVPGPLRGSLWRVREGLTQGQQRVFERWLGVRTTGHVHGHGAAQAFEEGRSCYERCQWLPLRRSLRALEPDRHDVFVDLGSGKGQALLVAGRLRFGRVIGVEMDDGLTATARRNLDAARHRLRAGAVETVTADVLDWPVPDDVSVVFLFNPFRGDIFESTLERVFASHDRHPRPLTIVYLFPWEHNRLLRSGRVVVTDVLPGQWPAPPWWWRTSWLIVHYRVVAPGEAGAAVPGVRRRPLRRKRAVAHWSGEQDHVFELERAGVVIARSDA